MHVLHNMSVYTHRETHVLYICLCVLCSEECFGIFQMLKKWCVLYKNSILGNVAIIGGEKYNLFYGDFVGFFQTFRSLLSES